MFKTYDSALQAWTEHPPKHYDTSLGAWVDSPSAKTFDTAQNAWVERLYQGYFSLRHDSYSPILSSGDEFIVTSNEITIFTAKKAERRFLDFRLPFEWKGDTVEFDITTNGIASVYFGNAFFYGNSSSVSGAYKSFTESHNGHVSDVITGSTPKEYEGKPVTNSDLYIQISVSAENAGNDIGYVNIKNLKINGKKYGFKE